MIALACLCLSLAAEERAERVVILVIDGARWTETWGQEGRPNIPRRVEMAKAGTWYADFANDGPTYTNAGHTALSTGFYQEINNSGKELPAHAGVFQRYLATSGAKATDAWIVTSKDKLDILADTTDPEWTGKHRPSTDCGKDGKGGGSGYRDDSQTVDRLLAILAEHKPHLVLVNLREPDSSGHAKDWEGYLKGIRDTDQLAGRVWDFLQQDPVYAGHTALFITNDHGRHFDGHKDGYVSHGDDCPGCHKIELLAMGPGFAPGAVVAEHHGQIDVAATAAHILGLRASGVEGHGAGRGGVGAGRALSVSWRRAGRPDAEFHRRLALLGGRPHRAGRRRPGPRRSWG
ncbi:MAG: alkaline phosphatase family protein [Minicystis sp.]